MGKRILYITYFKIFSLKTSTIIFNYKTHVNYIISSRYIKSFKLCSKYNTSINTSYIHWTWHKKKQDNSDQNYKYNYYFMDKSDRKILVQLSLLQW